MKGSEVRGLALLPNHSSPCSMGCKMWSMSRLLRVILTTFTRKSPDVECTPSLTVSCRTSTFGLLAMFVYRIARTILVAEVGERSPSIT